MTTSQHPRTAPAEAELREAVHEVQQYFSDLLAPMMVADSVTKLLRCPPELTAHAIQAWVGTQLGGARTRATVSDYVFHTVKKLHQMAEYDLVPADRLAEFLSAIEPHVVEFCPAGERDRLRENLARVDQSDGGPVASVEYLHRQAESAEAAAGSAAHAGSSAGTAGSEVDVARGMRRFSMLLERLGSLAGVNADDQGTQEDRKELSTHALATAAVQARDSEEFRALLGRMESAGVSAPMDQVFRQLSRTLPGWAMPLPEQGSPGGELPPSRSAQAMHRLLTLSADPDEGIQRFAEMLQAAIERFNDGHLPQATTMLELADRVAVEQDLDPERVLEIRRRQQDQLSRERMVEFAEQPARHALLRRVMRLFPATTVSGLLDTLQGDERPERRREATVQLEAYGETARDAVLSRLGACLEGAVADPDGRFRHGLVALLGRSAAATAEHEEQEVVLLARCTDPRLPVRLVREAIWVLGGYRQPRVESLLIKRLGELEAMARNPGEATPPAEALHGLMDRTAAALARQGGRGARRTIANHGLRRDPGFGECAARLEDLAGSDLSADPDLVRHLLGALQNELPKKMLGLFVGKSSSAAVHLVRALSSTPSDEVRQQLQAIVDQYAGQPFAEAAASALAGFEQPAEGPASTAATPAADESAGPSASLTGDIELFGLPNLLQSLAGSRVSGALRLTDRQGRTFGEIGLIEGRLAACTALGLSGEDGFYQLFERPVPGTFAFERGEQTLPEGAPAPQEIEPALLEALRRFDEFQAARALVPDDATYEATEVKPAPIEDDDDVELMRQVWTRASTGVPAAECEREMTIDVYRVRRLYAHWLEHGALGPRAKADEADQAG